MFPKSPIHSNHVFNPSIIDKSFTSWQANGIREINDLYYEGAFCSFQQMCEQFNIPKNNFFRYLQIRVFIRKMFPQFPAPPPCSPFDHLLEDPPRLKVLAPLHTSFSHLKSLWEDDLDMVISNVDWEKSCAEYTNRQFAQDMGFCSAKLCTVNTGQNLNNPSTSSI